jgi:hypothetical protein
MRIKTYFRWALWAIVAIVVWLAGFFSSMGSFISIGASIFGIRCASRQRIIPSPSRQHRASS